MSTEQNMNTSQETGTAQKVGTTQVHTIAPVYDENSRILILGSFPSVKSREQGFFYGHPRNRFWKVLAGITEAPVPVAVEEKKNFLLEHRIAVWDVIAACTIRGSSDASIRDVVPVDLTPILETAKIQRIFTNGSTSDRLYQKYLKPATGMEAVRLPSTSPANAAFSYEQLCEEWKICLSFLKD